MTILSDKLNEKQYETLWGNRALLLCMMNKGSECRSIVQELTAKFPNSSISSSISVCLLVREKNIDGALKLLESLPVTPLHKLLLAHVHLLRGRLQENSHGMIHCRNQDNWEYMMHCRKSSISFTYYFLGKPEEAVSVLQTIPEYQHLPGMVATIVAIQESAGKIEKALEYLKSSIAFYESKDPHSADYITLKVIIVYFL